MTALPYRKPRPSVRAQDGSPPRPPRTRATGCRGGFEGEDAVHLCQDAGRLRLASLHWERRTSIGRWAMPSPAVAVLGTLLLAASAGDFAAVKKACDGGSAADCRTLGVLYARGEGGAPKESPKAAG